MNYLDLSGKPAACEPLGNIFNNIEGQGPEAFRFAQPSGHVFLDMQESISHIMRIVASKPKYLPESEIPWILAHIDDFRNFCRNEDLCWRPFGFYAIAKNYVHNACHGQLDGDYHEAPEFISLTRRFVALGIIKQHLYGFDIHVDCIIGQPGVTTEPELSTYSEEEGFMAEIWVDGILKFSNNANIEFTKDSIDFLYEKKFKTTMSQDFFKRARGIFKIPDSMGLIHDDDIKDEPQTIPSGYVSEFEIDRFYLTNGSWHDRAIPELNPFTSDDALHLVSGYDEPFYRCYLRENGMTKRDKIVNIPLSWVTHSYGRPFDYMNDPVNAIAVESHRV